MILKKKRKNLQLFWDTALPFKSLFIWIKVHCKAMFKFKAFLFHYHLLNITYLMQINQVLSIHSCIHSCKWCFWAWAAAKFLLCFCSPQRSKFYKSVHSILWIRLNSYYSQLRVTKLQFTPHRCENINLPPIYSHFKLT